MEEYGEVLIRWEVVAEEYGAMLIRCKDIR
jgi:hypothetical protein